MMSLKNAMQLLQLLYSYELFAMLYLYWNWIYFANFKTDQNIRHSCKMNCNLGWILSDLQSHCHFVELYWIAAELMHWISKWFKRKSYQLINNQLPFCQNIFIINQIKQFGEIFQQSKAWTIHQLNSFHKILIKLHQTK